MFGSRKLPNWTYYQDKIVRHLKARSKLFITWFNTSPAENYITMDLSDRDKDEKYVLTIQRVRGKTPSQVMQVMQDDIVRYRTALREIGELAWDVRDPNQAKARIQEISALAGIIDET